MKTKIKICGIRSLEAAQTAISAGADYIGFNFISSSKRYINPNEAKHIIDKIKNTTKIVGVFQNELLSTVKSISSKLGLEYIQLQGSEDPKYCDELKEKVIKTFSVHQNFDAITTFLHMKNYNTFYYLLDRYNVGNEPLSDVHKLSFLTRKFPVFLSGGLTSSNVFDVISTAQPYGIDVCEAVETNGKEDVIKIREFLYEAK